MGFSFGIGGSSGSQQVTLGPEHPEEALYRQQFLTGNTLGGLMSLLGDTRALGGQFQGFLSQLMGESRQLPSALTIQQFLTGEHASLPGMSNRLIQPIIQSARSNIDDFLAGSMGSNAVFGALSGTAGSSALQGRQLMSRQVGAQSLANVISEAHQRYNPLALGQQIGGGLAGLRDSNRQIMGSLFQIGNSIFGQAGSILGMYGDTVARELQRQADYRIASANTYTKGKTGNFGYQSA